MLVAELDRHIIGAGFAFRNGSSPQCRTATLRNVAVLPPHDGVGLTGCQLAAPCGHPGPSGEFYLSTGYRGRRRDGLRRWSGPRSPTARRARRSGPRPWQPLARHGFGQRETQW
jgi:hypothetical protein